MRRDSGKPRWAKRAIVAALLFATAIVGGCAMIHSTSISDMAKGPGHRIRAEDTAHGFFMISMPELDAGIRLRAQCAGTVTGVETTTWMRNWFFLVQHYHQETSGWCQTN
ncbi:MAG: hypothetical protein HY075_07585 [Deltaproteobacteria bacterium]|nr:hypothetical protein [Deltaproteobacteria bacterium]